MMETGIYRIRFLGLLRYCVRNLAWLHCAFPHEAWADLHRSYYRSSKERFAERERYGVKRVWKDFRRGTCSLSSLLDTVDVQERHAARVKIHGCLLCHTILPLAGQTTAAGE